MSPTGTRSPIFNWLQPLLSCTVTLALRLFLLNLACCDSFLMHPHPSQVRELPCAPGSQFPHMLNLSRQMLQPDITRD